RDAGGPRVGSAPGWFGETFRLCLWEGFSRQMTKPSDPATQLGASDTRDRLAELLRQRARSAAAREALISRGQKALWLLHQFDPQTSAYHVGLALRVVSPLDDDALGGALADLV